MRHFLLALCVFMTGCASVSYMQSEYGSMKYVEVGGYRYWDKPAQNRMLIALDNKSAINLGLNKSAGTGSGTIAEEEWRRAAVSYLASTGRTCTATNVKTLLEPTNYEVSYTCS